jgi:hypothetical protein
MKQTAESLAWSVVRRNFEMCVSTHSGGFTRCHSRPLRYQRLKSLKSQQVYNPKQGLARKVFAKEAAKCKRTTHMTLMLAEKCPEIPKVMIQVLIAFVAFGASRSMRLLVSVSRVFSMHEMYESRQMFQSPGICCVMGPVIGYAVRMLCAVLRWYLSPKGSEGDLARPGKTWQDLET